ncbi:MAG TPA: phosphatase PAP2 family protein [Flavipsychrobacter sp.]|jgi:membrane-associated phospholipid phosphatase|nr:phosphatase PAP2 family protein [Flavipsychrobacter sp.]
MKRFFSVLVFVLALLPFSYGQTVNSITSNNEIIKESIRFAPEPPKDEFASGEEKMYRIRPWIDIPVTAVSAAWTVYAFSKIYDKDSIPYDKLLALSKDDVNSFDRSAAGNSNPDLSHTSNYLFYGSIPLPALLFIDKKIRKDAGKIAFLYLESFSVTGKLYTGSVYFVDRYRPETYNTSLSLHDRSNGNNKNSFFAGHVAVVANATFFMAKIYNDYHAESNWKWAFWGGAVAATGAMSYLRYESGKHFPSDIAVGVLVGALSGVLTPEIHKLRHNKDHVWNISPSTNPYSGDGLGLRFTYNMR